MDQQFLSRVACNSHMLRSATRMVEPECLIDSGLGPAPFGRGALLHRLLQQYILAGGGARQFQNWRQLLIS